MKCHPLNEVVHGLLLMFIIVTVALFLTTLTGCTTHRHYDLEAECLVIDHSCFASPEELVKAKPHLSITSARNLFKEEKQMALRVKEKWDARRAAKARYDSLYTASN